MKYHLIKLAPTGTTHTLAFDTHTELVLHLRNMFSNQTGWSIVAIYIGP